MKYFKKKNHIYWWLFERMSKCEWVIRVRHENQGSYNFHQTLSGAFNWERCCETAAVRSSTAELQTLQRAQPGRGVHHTNSGQQLSHTQRCCEKLEIMSDFHRQTVGPPYSNFKPFQVNKLDFMLSCSARSFELINHRVPSLGILQRRLELN